MARLTVYVPDELAERAKAADLNIHPVAELAAGAWARRADLRLTDALHVELAARLRVQALTTDHRLARASSLAEPISRPDGVVE